MLRVLICCLTGWLSLLAHDPLWVSSEGDQSLEEIVSCARQENHVIVAVFLKSKECPWSELFVQEILSGSQFLEQFEGQVILWTPTLLDRSDAKLLIERYKITDLPVVLLLDPHGREFYRTSELPIDKFQFIKEIREGIEDFQRVCETLDQDRFKFEEEEWKDLYKKAQRFSVDYYAKVLLELGVQREKGIFFHLEKYASLLKSCKKNHPQLMKLKKQLLKRKAGYQEGIQFHLAAAEFRHKISRKKQKKRLNWVLKPLVHYLCEHGKRDKWHRWKAEWLIAEYLSSRELFSLALEHATAAHEIAPEPFKGEIAHMIEQISL